MAGSRERARTAMPITHYRIILTKEQQPATARLVALRSSAKPPPDDCFLDGSILSSATSRRRKQSSATRLLNDRICPKGAARLSWIQLLLLCLPELHARLALARFGSEM